MFTEQRALILVQNVVNRSKQRRDVRLIKGDILVPSHSLVMFVEICFKIKGVYLSTRGQYMQIIKDLPVLFVERLVQELIIYVYT
jgi:hypothetical protein